LLPDSGRLTAVANEKHVARLKQGVDAWNGWRFAKDALRPDLTAANLMGADLIGSDLSNADLRGADLSGADLSDADLRYAELSDANLSRADFTRTVLFETDFSVLDLSSGIGLETCVHLGPSIIDHRTLERSGPLPISFLRGLGLSYHFQVHLNRKQS
jgi:uncharacterized protein YjbI with pentapeptide repeats